MYNFQPCHVLIVDDNCDGANTLSMLLRIWGVEATVAYDALSVIQLARELLPDFILMDIEMPQLSGYDAARLLRQDTDLERSVLIAMTGWAREEDRARALQSGFDFHLPKPIDFDALKSILRLDLTRAAASYYGSELRI